MKRAMLFLALTMAFPVSAVDTASTVLACMQANVPESLRVQEMEFETSNAAGPVSLLKGRLYLEREKTASGEKLVRAMLKMSAPQTLSGAAYLIREKDAAREDGMYVYLPSVKRVRRVNGSFADSGLMGTSFSYADFRLMQNSLDGAELVLEAADKIGERAVHRLLVRPVKSKTPTGYGVVRLWVDQQSCVPLKAEFEQGGAVRKRLSVPVEALQRSGDRWYPAMVEMQDEKEGLRTVLRMRGLSEAEKLSGGYFDAKTFYQR